MTGLVGAALRRGGWRVVLAGSGGLRVVGSLPERPCVIVANHSSHADTAALLAAIPAARQPRVAAAADYWFVRSWRAIVCRALAAGFPVRRSGGGSADLTTADGYLAAGHDVVIYPEGSRSRDGTLGDFRSGAARLAARTGSPLVPVALMGTRQLLPAHGRVRRTAITVHIGQPVAPDADARAAVASLLGAPAQGDARDSRLRQAIARFAALRLALVVMLLWAAAEALSWPLLPEFALGVLVVALPARALRLGLAAVAGTILGGALMYAMAASGVAPPAPLTTARMHETVAASMAADGAAAVRAQPFSGIPYKVYGAAAGHAGVGVGPFLAESLLARGPRVLGAALLLGLFGAVTARWRRLYPSYLVLFLIGFSLALATIVTSWS